MNSSASSRPSQIQELHQTYCRLTAQNLSLRFDRERLWYEFLRAGFTLHNYRYAWAERGADNAYPERYAQRVLGQNSKIVHRAYAKKAQGELPSLEEYEKANREAKKSGKILVIQHEAEVPKVA